MNYLSQNMYQLEVLKDLDSLIVVLKEARDWGEKREILLQYPKVKNALADSFGADFPFLEYPLAHQVMFLSLVALDQDLGIFPLKENGVTKESLNHLFSMLLEIDSCYENLGGVIGYHVTVMKLVMQEKEEGEREFLVPPVFSLSAKNETVREAVLEGLRVLPEMGEIYPIGGLGSRLNLKNRKGDLLPAVCLPFGGRTLLEGLIRDLQAREFLYYRLFGKQVRVPVALMTSGEKENATRVRAICEKKRWFGRGRESFFLFSQISVPVITKDGQWVWRSPGVLEVQPGGHGALWRTAAEKGVFLWFEKQERHRFLIRQINNPLGGVDNGLLALVGVGVQRKASLGFASCERLPNAAEGALVLVEEGGGRRISNIEYTEFKKYFGETQIAYPANTNILYADFRKLAPLLHRNPFPGLMVNMKSKVRVKNEEVEVGRLESMMQNISDDLVSFGGKEVPTFLTFNERGKTISVAKRSYEEGKGLLETPEGAFYDILRAGHGLLRECGFRLADFASMEEYMKRGPSVCFVYHPGLGPLYERIVEKLRGGEMSEGSELQLEIADFVGEDLSVSGSCVVEAENVLGHWVRGELRYSYRTGKCVLRDVRVENRGVDWGGSLPYWKGRLRRRECLRIEVRGCGEFYAEGVVFRGSHRVVVPDGERWIAKQAKNGAITYLKEKCCWKRESDFLGKEKRKKS